MGFWQPQTIACIRAAAGKGKDLQPCFTGLWSETVLKEKWAVGEPRTAKATSAPWVSGCWEGTPSSPTHYNIAEEGGEQHADLGFLDCK